MAIYHLSVKPVSRAVGRSATAAAAYRAGGRITDERTGEIHDYTRKGGVEFTGIVAPFGVRGAHDREALWNAAEAAEKRKDARVAREFEIALPEELPAHERRRVAVEFARELVDRYGVVADVAVHAPSRHGDDRNHHAHILCTTRQVKRGEKGDLVLGEKASLELSDTKRGGLGLCSAADEITELRALWAQIANRSLEHHSDQRVDHRSLKDQGITDRLPGVHLGPAATQMHRRGVKSDKWLSWERANEALQAAAEAGRLAGEAKAVERSILVADADLAAAIREREAAMQFEDRLDAALRLPVEILADPHTIAALDAGWKWPGVEVVSDSSVSIPGDALRRAGADIRHLPMDVLPLLACVDVDKDDGALSAEHLDLLRAAGDEFVDGDSLTMDTIYMVLARDDRVLKSRQDMSPEQIEAWGTAYMTSGDGVRKREQGWAQEAARERGEPEQESSKEMEREAEQAKPIPTLAQPQPTPARPPRQPNRGRDFER